MMNLFPKFSTSSANIFCGCPGGGLCLAPANSISGLTTTSPAWMILLTMVHRLPLSHALIITKRLFGVKIRGCAFDFAATPRTLPRYSVFPQIRSPFFGCPVASLGAKFLLSITRAFGWLSAYKTSIRLSDNSPSIRQVTFIGAEPLRFFPLAAKARLINASALLTFLGHIFHFHGSILLSYIHQSSIELNAEYCALAKRRVELPLFAESEALQ